jgi:hypothetical protein
LIIISVRITSGLKLSGSQYLPPLSGCVPRLLEQLAGACDYMVSLQLTWATVNADSIKYAETAGHPAEGAPGTFPHEPAFLAANL